MDRLFNYWAGCCPRLGADGQSYIRGHASKKQYRREQVIKLETERFPFFCIVLEGLVAGYRKNSYDKFILCELMQPMDYFTGTQHPFTPRIREAEYVAIENSVLLLIPVAEAREAQLRHPAFAELVHIMKQRKINFLELLIAIDAEEASYARYCLYMERFPYQAAVLPALVLWQTLRVSRATYYRAKARYFRTSHPRNKKQ